MMPDRDAILTALESVIDPELHKPVTELDMVRDVTVQPDGSVEVTIALTVAGCPMRSSFEDQVQRFVGAVEGVASVQLHFDVMSPDEKAALSSRLRGGRPEKTISLDPSTRVLAIASGKGGVGKSTLTANLAAALAARGERVGVLDADVYGHSIPHMLGVNQRPVVVDTMIVPPVRGDLKLMSIGFFLDDNAPVMWRGPMLHRALEQFLSDVYWGELDTLVVDMPPGTGDVAISLGQLLPRAEVVIVTTPQPAAQQVAVRAAGMAEKVGMRIVGVVENMSYLVGTGQEIFGSGGGQRLADEIGAPLLGSIPLDPALREAGGCRHADPRSGARRRGDGGDRRARRADPADPPGHDSQAADRSLLEKHRKRRRAPAGALLRNTRCLRPLVVLLQLAERPGGADVRALHLDPIADFEAGGRRRGGVTRAGRGRRAPRGDRDRAADGVTAERRDRALDVDRSLGAGAGFGFLQTGPAMTARTAVELVEPIRPDVKPVVGVNVALRLPSTRA